MWKWIFFSSFQRWLAKEALVFSGRVSNVTKDLRMWIFQHAIVELKKKSYLEQKKKYLVIQNPIPHFWYQKSKRSWGTISNPPPLKLNMKKWTPQHVKLWSVNVSLYPIERYLLFDFLTCLFQIKSERLGLIFWKTNFYYSFS